MRATSIEQALKADPTTIVIGEVPEGTAVPDGTARQTWFTALDADKVEMFARGDVCGLPAPRDT